MRFFLAGDLGGTKTVLALFKINARGAHGLVREQRYRSSDFADLGAMIRDFLGSTAEQPEVAAFGVAGPVVRGAARITNLGWTVDQDLLGEQCGFTRVVLLNDLVAIAGAVPFLTAEDLWPVNGAVPISEGTIAVIAPGTGLGEAYLCWDGKGYQAYPSEGGHVDFAPLTEQQQDLLNYLRKAHGHVSYEFVCSGMAIPMLFRYLSEEGGFIPSRTLRDEMAAVADHTPVIVRHALADNCAVSTATVHLFLEILAAAAGNMALTFMATGGVFLAGGILPRLLPLLDREKFMQRFRAKGRMSGILDQIAVKVVTRENVALLGASFAARHLMKGLDS